MLAVGWILLAGPSIAFGDTGDDTGVEEHTETPEPHHDPIKDTDVPEDTDDTDEPTEEPMDIIPPSAAAITGEEGGFGCATGVPGSRMSILILGLFLVRRSR